MHFRDDQKPESGAAHPTPISFLIENPEKGLLLPFGEDQEELVNKRGSHSVGVELAGPGHQHGPRYSPQKAQHVGVDPSTCREALPRSFRTGASNIVS